MTLVPCDSNAVLTVSDLNRLARLAIEKSLPSCWIRGEVSNFSRATSGHWYFTLKDSQAGVRCVMFRTRNQLVDWLPGDGDQVEVRAQPTLYEQRGDYQLLADAIRKAGIGSLFEAFMKLKARLAEEGLFSQARKRPLPSFPHSIGIITSPKAAALRDVLSTLQVRWSSCKVVIYPSLVQGVEAPQSLVAAIKSAGARRDCDVLLLVRGGGSLEDMQSFNDERVARAVSDCPIPIVTGVGHETDFTIADFVSDLRAPTPTGAAQSATPSRSDLLQHLKQVQARLVQAALRNVNTLSQTLDGLSRRVAHPRQRHAFQRQRVTHLYWRLATGAASRVRRDAEHLQQISAPLSRAQDAVQDNKRVLVQLGSRLLQAERQFLGSRAAHVQLKRSQLEMLNPNAVLSRGYSILRDLDGNVVRDAEQVVLGQVLDVTLSRGHLSAEILKIHD